MKIFVKILAGANTFSVFFNNTCGEHFIKVGLYLGGGGEGCVRGGAEGQGLKEKALRRPFHGC